MFRSPRRECEPAPLLFARVLRAAAEPAGPLFGDDVGADLTDEAPKDLGIDAEAVRFVDRALPTVTSEMKTMLLETLGSRRGVLAALPAINGLSAKPLERVVPLGSKAVAGHAWWWLWWLQRTSFSRRDSYTYRTDEVVYRVGGDARQSFNWFPGKDTYGTAAGKLSALIEFGIAVYVRELSPTPHAPDFKSQVQHAAVQAYTQLEAAAHGIAPAVFATMAVTDSDDYQARADAKLEATSAAEGLALVGDPQRITAVVTVAQVHTFRYSDMLRAYAGMGPEENRALAKQAVVQATHDVCNHMNALARLKVVKLTTTADSVVFCPELRETEDDEWEILGYTFRAARFDPIAGKPKLIDYDHRLCKRLGAADGYDVSCAYLMMATVFLASIRAEFPAVYPMVYEAFQTFGHWKDAVKAAPEKLDGFRNLYQRTFVHTRVERDPLPKGLLESIIDDFVAVLSKPLPDPSSAYNKLLLWLLGTRSYTPSSLGTDEDVAAERAQHRKDAARVEAAIANRRQRLLARNK